MMVKSGSQTWDSLSWFEKLDFAKRLMFYPALTLMVFTRRKLGFRILSSTTLFVMTAIMIAFATFIGYLPINGDNSALGKWALILYAIAMLAFGLWERHQRWIDLVNGVRWHTRTTGISRLAFLPLPSFYVTRYAEPVLCAVIGLILAYLVPPLGFWLLFSAGALATFEQNIHEQQLARDLDTLDNLITSEVQAETVQHFAGDTPIETARNLEDTAGIPTGVAPDIQKQIARRQKQKEDREKAERRAQNGTPSPAPLLISPGTEEPPKPAEPPSAFSGEEETLL